MKRITLSILVVLLSTNVLSEVSNDWLDDDILFDDSDAQLELELGLIEQQSEFDDSELTDIDDVKSNQNNTEEISPSTINQETSIQSEDTTDASLNSDAKSEDPKADNETKVTDSTNSQPKQTSSNTQKLDNVVITGELDKTTMTEDTKKLFSMPGSGGDPLKALSALPGINSASSFQGAPSVRGSAPEDNTFLVDSLPVANLYHLLGYSIFSDNVVQNFDIQTGAFPAKYAGGTGAAIYVDLREPKVESPSYAIDLGMFHSGVFFESKINDNQSIYFGARKSTISFFAPLLLNDDEPEEVDEDEEESVPPTINQFPNSDDIYLKYTNKINNQHKINYMLIGAQDYFGIEFPEGSGVEDNEPALLGELAINNKQITTGVNWEYQKDKNNLFDTSIGYLYFNLDIIIGDGFYNKLFVNSLITKTNYENSSFDDHVLSSGLELQSDNADYDSRILNNPCSNLEPDCSFSAGFVIETEDNITINYYDSYIQDEWFINDKFTWTNGVHVSYDDYIQDSIIQPRSKLEDNWYDEWKFNAAFGVHHQFPEITNLLPKFGNPDLKNITALHYVLGVEKNTYSGLKIKTDTYYKKLNNVVVATGDERLYSNEANGEAFGLEVLLEQEKVGDFSGFLALSVSKSTRTNEITNETALFELDKPFVLDWVLSYEPNQRWKIGSKWNLSSGKLYTPVIGSKPLEGFPDSFEAINGEYNSERFPMTHQLDVRIEYKKISPKKEIVYYVDIINLYNQKNVENLSYNADFSEVEEETGGFPFLPLLGMKVSF